VLALAINLSWEIINLFYVCEMPLEKIGLIMWLVLDIGLVYTTVRFGPKEWGRSCAPSASQSPAPPSVSTSAKSPTTTTTTTPSSGQAITSNTPWVGRNIGLVLTLLTAAGCVVHWAFSVWWLAVPGRGYDPNGDKTGKWWGGHDRYDTSEMAFWSAGISQLVLSYCSLAMLQERGHSGGTSYGIWSVE